MRTLTFPQAVRQTSEEKEFFSIGCTPTDEPCTPAGERPEDAIIECKVLRNQLTREHGQAPARAEFFIVENFHDFGTYYELNIFFVPELETEDTESPSQNYAHKCEYLPAKWDASALQELRIAGHTKYQPAKVIHLKTA